MAEAVIDLSLEAMPDLSPRIREKLKENSVETVLDLATAIPGDIEVALGGKDANAAGLILSARKLLEESGLLERSFITAADAYERRKRMS
jgi:predicted RecB family nuclease